MNILDNIDFEKLKQRRNKILERRSKEEEIQEVGLGYNIIIDGKIYPILSFFPVQSNLEYLEDKLNYLINGRK